MPSSPRRRCRHPARCPRRGPGAAAAGCRCAHRGLPGPCAAGGRALAGHRRRPQAGRRRRSRTRPLRSRPGVALAAAGAVEGVVKGIVTRLEGITVCRGVRTAPSPAAGAAIGLLSGPAALDALGGEVLARRPAVVWVLVAVRCVIVVVVVHVVASATARPSRFTTQERHATPPGTARPGVGASEARAAMYASLPPLSRAPIKRSLVRKIVTNRMPTCPANRETSPPDHRKTGHFWTKHPVDSRRFTMSR